MRSISKIVMAGLLVAAVQASAETLNVENVVTLTEMKLGDEAIIAKMG